MDLLNLLHILFCKGGKKIACFSLANDAVDQYYTSLPYYNSVVQDNYGAKPPFLREKWVPEDLKCLKNSILRKTLPEVS